MDVRGAEPEEELELEVEREIERGGEECRASEKVRMLIEKAELPLPKKGMLLKPTKPRVEPTQE